MNFKYLAFIAIRGLLWASYITLLNPTISLGYFMLAIVGLIVILLFETVANLCREK